MDFLSKLFPCQIFLFSNIPISKIFHLCITCPFYTATPGKTRSFLHKLSIFLSKAYPKDTAILQNKTSDTKTQSKLHDATGVRTGEPRIHCVLETRSISPCSQTGHFFGSTPVSSCNNMSQVLLSSFSFSFSFRTKPKLS